MENLAEFVEQMRSREDVKSVNVKETSVGMRAFVMHHTGTAAIVEEARELGFEPKTKGMSHGYMPYIGFGDGPMDGSVRDL